MIYIFTYVTYNFFRHYELSKLHHVFIHRSLYNDDLSWLDKSACIQVFFGTDVLVIAKLKGQFMYIENKKCKFNT